MSKKGKKEVLKIENPEYPEIFDQPEDYEIYSKDYFKFCFNAEGDCIIFTVQNVQYFPVKEYELKILFKELQNMNYFEVFNYKTAGKFLNNVIKKCIDLNKYNIKNSTNDDSVIFEMNWEIFDNNYAEIKIPKKGLDLDLSNQVESLALIVSEMDKKINENENNIENPNNKKRKEEAAINSFVGTSFLNNDEKKLISEWIHPNKVLKFVLLYTNAKDSDSSSYFHYFCDGAYPTVTVVYDTSGRRFGGYSTQSWGQSPVGAYYSRAVGSFIFNLSNKTKYTLVNPLDNNAIYRNNSYGPSFGAGYDLYIANGCKSNSNSSCSKSSYNTGSYNLLGGSSSTSFQVNTYEVYHVINE